MKHLLTLYASLIILSCSPAPATAASPTEFCYKMSDFSLSIASARDRGVTLERLLSLTEDSSCTNDNCRIIKQLNRDFIFTAYSGNLSGQDLKMLYNVRCLTKFR